MMFRQFVPGNKSESLDYRQMGERTEVASGELGLLGLGHQVAEQGDPHAAAAEALQDPGEPRRVLQGAERRG